MGWDHLDCQLWDHRRVASVVSSFVRLVAVTVRVTEAAGMAFQEVSVNEIREVLRVWLVIAGAGLPHDRRALRRGPQNGVPLRGVNRPGNVGGS